MVNVDVHGPVQGADKGGLIGTQSFMSSVDGLCLPVGPVYVLLKQSHGKDVRDVLAENCKAPGKNNITLFVRNIRISHQALIYHCYPAN